MAAKVGGWPRNSSPIPPASPAGFFMIGLSVHGLQVDAPAFTTAASRQGDPMPKLLKPAERCAIAGGARRQEPVDPGREYRRLEQEKLETLERLRAERQAREAPNKGER